MPFSKRPLTWSEEVFAGLIVLFLIIAAIVLWWIASIHTVGSRTTKEQQTNIDDMTAQEREQSAQEMAAELSAQSNAPHALTAEERAKAASQPFH